MSEKIPPLSLYNEEICMNTCDKLHFENHGSKLVQAYKHEDKIKKRLQHDSVNFIDVLEDQ